MDLISFRSRGTGRSQGTVLLVLVDPDRLGDRRDFVHELGSDSGEFMSRKRLLITLVT